MSRIHVVLFSGGRGSEVLSRSLTSDARIELTLAVNGYDDGKSTGEVRRFLGDSLGPSDFRKNASTLSQALQSCAPELTELLDLRLPEGCPQEKALAVLHAAGRDPDPGSAELEARVAGLASRLGPALRAELTRRIQRFEAELARPDRPFSFHDCAIGNLVFAGCFLGTARRFNAAIDDYCALLGLPPGCIENVSDGTNAYLVALDRDRKLLASEADIVDATRRNYIEDIYLIGRRLSENGAELAGETPEALEAWLAGNSVEIPPNQRLLTKIAEADLVIYAPGTQHSSLLPSYMTCGIGEAIARNLGAIKILVTNLQEDAEIPEMSGIEILEKALYYLRDKGRRHLPTPCLITHCLLNDASTTRLDVPYVSLGRLQSLEDPRLVRIANYEAGLSGRHDSRKVLTPFVETQLARLEPPEVAILLLDAHHIDKIYQTLLEAQRGGLPELGTKVTFYCASPEALDSFVGSLPFRVHNVWQPGKSPETALLSVVQQNHFDYVLLFESSGMYRGGDIVHVLTALRPGWLDAVWGSRRLSKQQIRESYQLRYRHAPVLRAISTVGSHLLSLVYLLLYGRYISDTLSGVRVLRSAHLRHDFLDLSDKCLNQHLLSLLLRSEGTIFETPVEFFPMSPDKVSRTSVFDGLQSIWTILSWRFRGRAPGGTQPARAAESAAGGTGKQADSGAAAPSE